MARFSIGEDDEDAPHANKRQRTAETSSQSQSGSQRSVRSQPPVVVEEDEENTLFTIEDEESDSQRSEEEEEDEDDESEAEAEAEDDEEDGEEVDLVSEAFGLGLVYSQVEPVSEVQNRPQHTVSPVGPSHRGLPDITDAVRSSKTAPPVFNNANGALQVVLTDPDVLDCPICLDPLCSPVFQCENGHIACSSCCHKVKRKCPSCCMPIGYNRCRAIEKVLESIKVSCQNTQYGCKETISYSKKIEHEQLCPHSPCFCPHQSCPFTGSSKNLNLHFGIQHAASTTRFTFNTTFTLHLESNQKHIFLQEQHESVIFIVNHEVKQHGRALNIDCVGPGSLKTCFTYQLTAKKMETSLSLQSVPEVYRKWLENTPRQYCFTVPSEFVVSNGILSVNVCIKKAVLAV